MMKTSIIESPRKIVIRETGIPVILDEEVLVRLHGTGVCASNLPVWEGREWFQYPVEPGSPGHEGYGVVCKVGNKAAGLQVGDNVALLSHHAFAEYDKALASNVIKIPSAINDLPFPGEPLACAVNIFRRSDIRENDTVLVIGTGFMGCLVIQMLKDAGVKVIATSRRSTSLEFAEKAGADHLIQFNDYRKTVEQIRKLAAEGLPRIIEATGTQIAIDLATELIGTRGKMIIAGYHQDGIRTVNFQVWNWKGIDVINAHERENNVYVEGLKEAIKLTEKGILRPGELITHYFDFQDIDKAFVMLKNRPDKFLKAIITY
ncbi:MAG: MDR/zinc-dependent alcohol dehydrogenase-like family protein [Syntrophothermus sp.]